MSAVGEESKVKPSGGRCRLPRSKRLLSSDQISEAFQSRTAYRGKFLIIRLRQGPDAALRVGVVAGKKNFRRAVDRCRAKRLMRESFRLNQASFCGDCDIVLIAKLPILNAAMQDVAKDLLAVARRAGVIKKSQGKAENE
ncbi:MAG: ribonuclease P protein component [Candidatus Promineifilaceae bacterium]|jgi:ribonuclease P protein component